jgi:TRAP-type mannitol/chloroaromatic compound transport system permease small subunit
MLKPICKFADGVSWCASQLANVSVVVLTVAMVYEVFARYAFDAPTVWAFDIAYMANGVIFLLGVAWVLREDAHIRIDVLSNRLPPKLANAIEGLVYLLLLAPLFAALANVAIQHTWRAWIKQEVETVSPWAPLMWPFYLLISIGLVALTLQLIAEALRSFSGVRRPDSREHA